MSGKFAVLLIVSVIVYYNNIEVAYSTCRHETENGVPEVCRLSNQ